MKVHELVEHLQKFDPNLDVLCWSEDENLLGKKEALQHWTSFLSIAQRPKKSSLKMAAQICDLKKAQPRKN